jgi:DMSO/TMAO reductase YedYZ molybdopterin-dependent catalytic subunit
MEILDFPVWLRVTHWVNVLFITLLIRSGIEIVGTHPKFYWNDQSQPGSEFARFTRKVMPKDKLYDTLDEEEEYSSVVALPGHKKLGMGRHWHFFSVIAWILTGVAYFILLFATGQWHRYIPYSWSVFPQAWNDILTYLSFNLPPLLPGQPFDAIQKLTYGFVVMGARKLLLRPAISRQDYSTAELSTEHRVNGKPPDSDEYLAMAAHNFADWKLEVGGLVEHPVSLTLEDLQNLRSKQTQRVLHNCIQGWTSIGEWGGLPMRDLLELVKPLPEARFACLLTMQDTGREEPSAEGKGQFYEVIDLKLAKQSHTLLAYEMNGEPLPIKHGAPLRVRIENQVGFKMAKWVERIEFISDYSKLGAGMGGWREDNVHYDKNVEI